MRKGIIGVSIALVSIALLAKCGNSIVTKEVTGVKVNKLIQQQEIKGSKDDMKTEFRYLVITNKGTFIVESNFVHLKFNNSELFYNLKEDSTYNFTVSGIGKTFVTDYQNIISIN